jgi:hypothetical protein
VNIETPMPFLLLMPSFNQAHFIHEAVESILRQDDPDWELWIVDNSTDATPEVMVKYTDPRIRFHHIPQRMDPGSCLNWMLERAQGREFSYVHTDNNLRTDYVRSFRAALSADPLSLAYCDMNIIDGSGQRTGVFRRGAFNLPRLLSLSPLGVPFAATTELAHKVGGFSCDDAADDVLFCIRAYGLGEWTHLPDPLIDYRLHAGSRTEECGGATKVQRVFLRTFAKAIPELEARGLQPREAMVQSLRQVALDLRLATEDRVLGCRDLGVRWWGGEDYLDGVWKAGLLVLPGFTAREGGPRKFSRYRRFEGRWRNPMVLKRLEKRIRSVNQVINFHAENFRTQLLSYACLHLGDEIGTLRAGSSDAMTLWACKLLSRDLGWTIELAQPAPAWIRWPQAGGPAKAWIDLSGRGVVPAGVPSLVW